MSNFLTFLEKEKVYSRQVSAPILKRKSSRFGLGQLITGTNNCCTTNVIPSLSSSLLLTSSTLPSPYTHFSHHILQHTHNLQMNLPTPNPFQLFPPLTPHPFLPSPAITPNAVPTATSSEHSHGHSQNQSHTHTHSHQQNQQQLPSQTPSQQPPLFPFMIAGGPGGVGGGYGFGGGGGSGGLGGGMVITGKCSACLFKN